MHPWNTGCLRIFTRRQWKETPTLDLATFLSENVLRSVCIGVVALFAVLSATMFWKALSIALVVSVTHCRSFFSRWLCITVVNCSKSLYCPSLLFNNCSLLWVSHFAQTQNGKHRAHNHHYLVPAPKILSSIFGAPDQNHLIGNGAELTLTGNMSPLTEDLVLKPERGIEE